MKVLVLGHNGMLGHMVAKYLSNNNVTVETITEKFPCSEFFEKIINFDGEYIVNAIGAIPQKTKEFSVNTDLPIWLEQHATCKVIHPGTDCEMDSDDYGTSKKIARDYIINSGFKTKILKGSIIGPELTSNKSLLEWVLTNNEISCSGYTMAMWNGITTYEWAKQCWILMNNWNSYSYETILFSNCISKFELLQTIVKVFDKQIEILPIDMGKNKCLNGDISTNSIEQQLIELKEYYYDNRC